MLAVLGTDPIVVEVDVLLLVVDDVGNAVVVENVVDVVAVDEDPMKIVD